MVNKTRSKTGKWAYSGDNVVVDKGNVINLIGYLNKGISEDDVRNIASQITKDYVNSIDAVVDTIDGNIIITDKDILPN